MNRLRNCIFLLLISITAAVFVSPVEAQTAQVTILHYFDDGSVANDGYQPDDLILGADGNFYGTTFAGGAGASRTGFAGTVFKLTPAGTETILHNFDDGSVSNDGIQPRDLVQGADGNFYGITVRGGSAGYGIAYKITPSGIETVLHQFGDGSVPNDGTQPVDLILGRDGNFYGSTGTGGTTGTGYTGGGTVFKITPSGTETILHNFGDGSVPDDGIGGAALVQGMDGDFYGTSYGGGVNNLSVSGGGTVFKITPSGVVTILHSFYDGSVPDDGVTPKSPLIQGIDGNFYGTTYNGGSTIGNALNTSGLGTLFKITPSGSVTILHSFGDGNIPNDGLFPVSAIIQGMDGNFYGTTQDGGSTLNAPVGAGTVFKMTPSGIVTILHDFDDGSVPNDGSNPQTPLVQGMDGNLYGTTLSSLNGVDSGTIYKINLSNVQLLTITSLSPASVIAGSPTFALTITGTGFTGSTTITFGGTPVTVTAQTVTQLTVMVPASDVAVAGVKTVAVSKPDTSMVTAAFTVTPPWSVRDVAAVSDGTARLLWARADGAAGVWALNAGNAQIAVGPTYGPYQGWTAQDITAAADGTSRILWNRYDGATGVWALNQAGVETSVGPTYGPFTGWNAIDLATAPNGTSRLLWRYTNGEAGLLSLNATGSQVISGRSYGPYTGWTATAVGASGDETARILWTRSDGAMGIWTMDATDAQQSVGPTYGPYSDSHGTWTATDLSTSVDGTSQVLWKRSDGAVGVWTFSASNTAVTSGPVDGPYAGWTAAAMDAASDKARVLWVNSTREAGLWSFGGNDAETLIGPIYGPY